MIDDEKNFAGAAAKEIEEETGFRLESCKDDWYSG
jgi:8-oxo-dGTP pyrophosphatase MutT (NUDIX family)